MCCHMICVVRMCRRVIVFDMICVVMCRRVIRKASSSGQSVQESVFFGSVCALLGQCVFREVSLPNSIAGHAVTLLCARDLGFRFRV